MKILTATETVVLDKWLDDEVIVSNWDIRMVQVDGYLFGLMTVYKDYTKILPIKY